MIRFTLIVVAVSACALAGCGGGSGSPSVLPTMQPKAAKVLATFGSSGSTPQSLFRSVMTSPMATVVGQIIPTQQLAVPDAYISGAPNTIGVEAQAVLDTTDGSAIPSPLPSVTWSQTGNPAPIPTTYPTWPLNNCSCQQVFNAEVVGLPTTSGQTTITMTSLGTTQKLSLLTYRGMGLRSSLDTTDLFHFLTGAMFDANGVSEQADTQADTDVYLDASTSPSQVVFPYGAVAAGYNALMNVTTTSACGAIPSAATSVSISTFNGSSPNTYCFKTHDGRIGKWAIFGASDPNQDIFAGYMLASAGAFTY
ncbi:MAG TPA: hypothetical protein VJP85_05630 [Candidatus Baltobacteraceae bacterium]|nr:hypothetical protein [Candidatus Baltobacteraceae bacterium]